MSRKFKKSLLVAALLPVGFAAQAQDGGFVQLTYGALNASNGYSDRDYIGLNSRFAVSSGLSILFDLSQQDREENVTSVGVGAEFAAGAGALRFMVESSNSDLGTAPDWKYALGYRYNAGADRGLIYDFEVSRANYEGDIDATSLRGEMVKYFPANANGSYLVTQLSASVTDSSGAADLGYDIAGVATLVTAGGLNVGAELAFGKIAYDLAPLAPVNNDYTAFRPFVSYRFSGNAEVILRGEYIDTELYDLQGASIGIKIGL
ncbi:hypothetical protein [Tabrizicola flagellatus]|uniref:hypothetical protein n=1 Tax=Tabrizicola flagellatus TaxID=2593021 RepID=UPI0011F22BC4|nr:hypothetical protein [Tabrizicola flagellatus]